MPETSLLYVLRHGETESDRLGRFAGWSDEALTSEGRTGCEALAERLAGEGVGSVYTSPVRRAVETAAILADHLHARARTLHDLREMEAGPWRGLTEDEVAERWPEELRAWREAPQELELEGRERLDDVRSRALEALDKIGRSRLAEEDELPAAVVTHPSLVRTIWLTARERPLGEFHDVDTPACGVFPVRWLGRGRIRAEEAARA